MAKMFQVLMAHYGNYDGTEYLEYQIDDETPQIYDQALNGKMLEYFQTDVLLSTRWSMRPEDSDTVITKLRISGYAEMRMKSGYPQFA
jgi:hypothetical protein